MTLVERASSCIVGWRVGQRRDEESLQALLDASPQAGRYYSDGMVSYQGLIYHPGVHSAMSDKSETYRVEGMNAELRHYLARLQRRSRCFSRCAEALRRSVKLFVYAWNRRQLYRRQHPGYPTHLINFLCH